MKFNCGPSFAERHNRKQQWHKWFAWRPIRLNENDCRWLEYVERKINYSFGDVSRIHYRELT